MTAVAEVAPSDGKVLRTFGVDVAGGPAVHFRQAQQNMTTSLDAKRAVLSMQSQFQGAFSAPFGFRRSFGHLLALW